MSRTVDAVEKRFSLSPKHAERLSHLARVHQVSEDHIVEKALDILFALADLLGDSTERQGWSFLSEPSLQRIWDNEQDAVYDNWRELYDVSTR